MNTNRCLYCYKPLKENEKEMHSACSRFFFGVDKAPELECSEAELENLARRIIQDQTSLTGVQPKLSLNLKDHEGTKRLTIVGLWGKFICKPQTPDYAQLPEVEDLTMHLAELCKIDVVPHTLTRMADGSLCYLTKRIDRTEDGGKIAMEDMCQITERQTEHKYKSSYERIGKAILAYSTTPQMDVTNFFEVVLFSWLTGNNDMHLKNFSLYEPEDGRKRLSPAYDLINACIINPKDDEELGLTLNGRKKKLKKEDFIKAAETMGINPSATNKIIKKYCKLAPTLIDFIKQSFVSEDLKEEYTKLIENRIERLARI